MKTSLKNISDTKVEITITLGAEELAIAEQVATAKLARDVKAPGFRKGKAPATVVAKNIDPMKLQEQTIDDAMSRAVATAFTDAKVQVLDRPAVAIKKMVPSEVLEFTATADILPTVKLGNYKKLKLVKEKVTVTKAEIDDTVERIRQGMAEKKEVKRAAKLGDETVIDFVGKRDGVAFDGGTGKDYPLTLGSNQFIPGFEDGVVGHKVGETFDIDLQFPDDYNAEALKGAKVTFTVTLNAVKELSAPELTDELAAKAGPFTTVDEMKADIKRELTKRRESENDDKVKDDLVKQLVAASKVPIPEILVDDQVKSIERDFVSNLSYQGLSLDDYLKNKGFESKEKWLETEVRDVATKRVQAALVLAEMGKQEKITAAVDEVNARVEAFKQQYANNAEALKQFELPEVRNDISGRLITEKTVDRLVELNSK